MKNTLILTVIFMTSISIFGQENKFTYEYDTGFYDVRPNFKEHANDDYIGAVGYFKDEKWIANSLDSVAQSALPKNKWNKLLNKQDKRGSIMISYLTSGQVYSIWFSIPETYKKVLSDKDFYNLYMSIKSFKMDMNKIRLEYPSNCPPDTKFIWSISTGFPVPEKYK